ncbi:bifunctional riboflavin kinase/FAD synthetase [Chelatococcus sp. GCM10030263]|uniref:bifunctional riboflavin kinase/FAD synthetase n=1 Tax=Chelatococcus sp. GCM10030263 TaxID=3273387 RepID=UPI00361338A7
MSLSPPPQAPFIIARGAPRTPALSRPILAIGNFDGVHRGHQEVLAKAVILGRDLGRPAAALTFDPHPSLFFAPQRRLFPLTPLPTKLRLMAHFGLDGAIVLTFDRALANTTAEAFVDDLLIGRIGAAGIVVGGDFHFGKGREGSPDYLTRRAAHHGVPVIIVAPVGDAGGRVSSTAIREALARGDVASANQLLGYRWLVSGTVMHGDKRGRTLGFPTANIHLAADCELHHGIYAVRVGHGGRIFDGVASFGRRPTFDNGAPLLEVHLFSFDGDLYEAPLDVEFVAWLRGEEKFTDVAALVQQMERDAADARRHLAMPEADCASLLEAIAGVSVESEAGAA